MFDTTTMPPDLLAFLTEEFDRVAEDVFAGTDSERLYRRFHHDSCRKAGSGERVRISRLDLVTGGPDAMCFLCANHYPEMHATGAAVRIGTVITEIGMSGNAPEIERLRLSTAWNFIDCPILKGLQGEVDAAAQKAKAESAQWSNGDEALTALDLMASAMSVRYETDWNTRGLLFNRWRFPVTVSQARARLAAAGDTTRWEEGLRELEQIDQARVRKPGRLMVVMHDTTVDKLVNFDLLAVALERFAVNATTLVLPRSLEPIARNPAHAYAKDISVAVLRDNDTPAAIETAARLAGDGDVRAAEALRMARALTR